MAEATISARASGENYSTALSSSRHTVTADEPIEKGGADKGMTPYELLLSSLGACTSITLRMYAERKGWKIEDLQVELELFREEEVTRIERKISLKGPLTEDNRQRLLHIARVCPVARILGGQIMIVSELLP